MRLTQSGPRNVVRGALVVILAGACFSLSGPAIYSEDVDRHLVQTVMLLDGDIGMLGQGLIASGSRTTLSGLFFAILGPAMALSGRPEWLWFYLDLIVLLGAIPLWYLVRSLSSETVAWVAVALFVASSGRIEHSWLGIHSSTVMTLGILFHYFLVRYLQSRRSRDLWIAAALLAACLSLHLSYLPLLAAGPALILWSKLPTSDRWRRVAEVSPGLAAALTATLAVGLVAGTLGVLGWDPGELHSAGVNLLFALAEHSGPSSPLLREGTWSYAPYPGRAAAAALVGIPVLLVGCLVLWSPHARLPAWLEISPDRVSLLRRWILVIGLVQLSAALIGVRAWQLTYENVWRHRHLTPLVPVIAILMTLGLAGIAGWIARTFPRAGRARPIALGLAWSVGGLHLLVLLVSYRDVPWRLSGQLMVPDLANVVEATRSRWGYNQEWFRTSVFGERIEARRLAKPRHEYQLHWLFRDPSLESGDGPGADKVMYVVRPGSALQADVLSTGLIIDSVVTPVHVVYLCRRDPGVLLDTEPFYLTYGPRREDRYLLGPRAEHLVATDLVADGGSYPLIAANIEISDSVPDVLAEVMLEEAGGGIVIGARLYGRGMFLRAIRDGIEAPHVLLRTRSGEVARFDFLDDSTRASEPMRVVDTVPGWQGSDLLAVFVGVDAFHSTGNPWTGTLPQALGPQVARLR